jgi:hypothetical protein
MVGRELELLAPATATALVTSGVLSVAVFPTAAYALLGGRASSTANDALDGPAGAPRADRQQARSEQPPS